MERQLFPRHKGFQDPLITHCESLSYHIYVLGSDHPEGLGYVCVSPLS